MKIHQGIAGHGRPEFLNKLSVELPNFFRWKINSIHKRHAPTEIDSGCDQSFFHWQRHVAVSCDSFFVTQCLVEAATKADTNVFHGMVMVHVQIANGLHLQIKQSMPREQREHVVKETHAGRDLILAAAVEIH
jgi:hypothetical protein